VVTAVSVTCTDADLVGSCTDVAVIFPEAGTMPAVNIPVALIFPTAAVAAQVTPSEELVRVAVNW